MRKLGNFEMITIFTKPVGYSPRRENPATNKNIPSHPRVSLRFWFRNPAVTLVNSYRKTKETFTSPIAPLSLKFLVQRKLA